MDHPGSTFGRVSRRIAGLAGLVALGTIAGTVLASLIAAAVLASAIDDDADPSTELQTGWGDAWLGLDYAAEDMHTLAQSTDRHEW